MSASAPLLLSAPGNRNSFREKRKKNYGRQLAESNRIGEKEAGGGRKPGERQRSREAPSGRSVLSLLLSLPRLRGALCRAPESRRRKHPGKSPGEGPERQVSAIGQVYRREPPVAQIAEALGKAYALQKSRRQEHSRAEEKSKTGAGRSR